MERYLYIAKSSLKHQLYPHILAAFFLCMLAPFIAGMENLDQMQTGMLVDCFLSPLGMILFVPIMFGEDDSNLRVLICSKKMPICILHGIRFLESLLVLSVLVLCFLWYLKEHDCSFPYTSFFFAVVADCIFLGGMGILFYAISNQIAVAYIGPVMYYILCFGAGKKYLGVFHLFTLMIGNVGDKRYLGIAGTLMLLLGFLLRSHNRSTLSISVVDRLFRKKE